MGPDVAKGGPERGGGGGAGTGGTPAPSRHPRLHPTAAPPGADDYGVGRAAGAGSGFRGNFSSRCAACHANAARTAAFHFMSSGWIFS